MTNIVKSMPTNARNSSLRRFMPNLFNEIIDDFISPGLYMTPLFNEPLEPQIRLDVSEKPKEFIVRAEIPGAKKEDIHVNIDGAYVNISAHTESESEEKSADERMIRRECFMGSCSRGFQLSSEINRDKAKASYENGVLQLILPKMNGGSVREIEIK